MKSFSDFLKKKKKKGRAEMRGPGEAPTLPAPATPLDQHKLNMNEPSAP